MGVVGEDKSIGNKRQKTEKIMGKWERSKNEIEKVKISGCSHD